MREPPPTSPHFLRALLALKPRQTLRLTQDVLAADGRRWLAAGAGLDDAGAQARAGQRLALPLDLCLECDDPVTPRALREAAEVALAEQPFFARMTAEPRVREVLLEALGALPLPAPLALQLTLLRELFPAAYTTALLGSLAAGYLLHADDSETTRYDVGMIMAAALLADLGMLHIDPVVFRPDEALGDSQRQQLHAHPWLSAQLIEPHHAYPQPVLRAVLEHHERLDGSGYPRALRADALSPWGRLLALALVVAAMFGSGRPQPQSRLSLLLRMNRGRYDEAAVARLDGLLDAAAPAPPAALSAAEVTDRLTRVLDAVHTPPVPAAEADPAQQLALTALRAQLDTLQRMLSDAGIEREQLGFFDGPALQAELLAIGREAQWQLRSAAQQLRQRWRPTGTLPAELQQWLARVDALAA